MTTRELLAKLALLEDIVSDSPRGRAKARQLAYAQSLLQELQVVLSTEGLED